MRNLIAVLPPAVTALLLQLAAFVLAALSVRLVNLQPAPLAFALLCGAYAATLSRLVGLAGWWLPIQFAFTPALVLVLALDIPPDYFLAAFLILLAVYWSTFRTQVPLYLSSDKVWHALESFLPSPTPHPMPSPEGRRSSHGAGREGAPIFRFIDLGCGLGGVLTHLARVRPDGHYTGIESAPLPFLWSWLRIRLGGHHNCEVKWGSIWDENLGACDLAQYDVVFAYLSPVPMKRLWQKARAEMRPGAVFISSTFAVPEQAPHETVQVNDLHRSTLLVWRM